MEEDEDDIYGSTNAVVRSQNGASHEHAAISHASNAEVDLEDGEEDEDEADDDEESNSVWLRQAPQKTGRLR